MAGRGRRWQGGGRNYKACYLRLFEAFATHFASNLCPPTHTHSAEGELWGNFGVATISRLLQIVGLFCRIQSLLFCKRDL